MYPKIPRFSRHLTFWVAPHLIVVQGGCKENEGPAIILCDLATSKPGGRAWTPQKYLSQLGESRQETDRARQHWYSFAQRTALLLSAVRQDLCCDHRHWVVAAAHCD